ncbi:MAG TPA: hypothetical protein PLE61_05645 [Vicinamibacterales bacterium]|nr:hypothetical protein [Vicinamibacterales bacterium]HPW20281.1 hypothetical protein [Vicinamibacterales bacterium]
MRRSIVAAGTLCLAVALTAGLGADVKSSHKTQVKFEGMFGRAISMFSGKSAKEGVVSTTAVSGDRMMSVTGQSGELVDLAEEKVYQIDFKDRSYKVKTFAEIRKEWEEAQAKMKEQAAAQKPAEQPDAEAQMEVDFSVNRTAERETINGYDCQKTVMTIAVRQKGRKLEESGGLVMTNDLWMAPEIAALKEEAAFQLRYMRKLLGNDAATMARDLAQAMAMYPMMKPAMERMQKESGKLSGTPIRTVMRVETVASPEQAQSQGDQPKPSIGGVAGKLGGLFGRKKKDDDAPAEAPAPAGAKNHSTLLTSTSELVSVSTAVTAEDVAIPAGFKQK